MSFLQGRASVRVRTTTAAVLVVAVVLLLGGVALVLLVRDSLRDGVQATAEQQVDALVEQVRTSGVPTSPQAPADDDPDDDDDEDDELEPEDLVWQVVANDGTVLATSQPLQRPLPMNDDAAVGLPEGESDYLIATERVKSDQGEVTVTVAATLEDVEESTEALIAPLAVGLPLVLLLVGGTTWLVVTRALAPVERIRSEVDQITGEQLDRRVPEPTAKDEVRRLAVTMNRMLGRLETSRDKQQQFVADASHELRSPLASIRQTAEVAVAHPSAMPEGELAEAVLEESIRLQRLVDQLLLLTRAESGSARPAWRDVDVDDVVLTATRRPARTDVRIDTSAVGAGRVSGDEIALGQVVRNLVDNAVRHASTTVAVGVQEQGEHVEITVDDDGPGIPAEDRDRVFERFVRLDEARSRDAGGSGLGLAIVSELVAAHGGDVRVLTAPLGGARVAVRLPRLAD